MRREPRDGQWLYTADPMRYPVILGDVVLAGISADGDKDGGDVPEGLVRDVFEEREFIVQVQPDDTESWHDTLARFENVFDAATWCMLLTHTLRPGVLLRMQSRVPLPDEFDISCGPDRSDTCPEYRAR